MAPLKPAEPRTRPPAVEGELARVRELLARASGTEALRAATAYRDRKPGDELAWVALGDVLLHQGKLGEAARAYGSLIDLAGDSAPKRRAAAGLLEAVELRARARDPKLAGDVLALAAGAYARARERRSDHPSSHELLAFALVKQARYEDAFEALASASTATFEPRFGNARALLLDDLGVVAAAWAARSPTVREELLQRLRALGAELPDEPSLRFVLSWETDTSDVNLIVSSGGRRVASERNGNNVRDGYGPEQVAVAPATNEPYRLTVSLDRRGFQGYALGKVAIVHHDGAGRLTIEDRPFVLMKEHGHADLGEYRVPAPK